MNLRALVRYKLVFVCMLLAGIPVGLGFAMNGRRWSEGITTFYTGIPGKPANSATTFAVAFEAAMQKWNDKTDFKFITNHAYVDPCEGYSTFPGGSGNSKNSIDFAARVCGNDFGSNVLAITLTSTFEGGRLGFNYLRETDIVFNSKYTWDVYDGPRTPGVMDFGRVALHELGHAIGLDHESSAPAIMAPAITNLSVLQPDDIAGANTLYGSSPICRVTELSLHALVRNSLEQPDCRMMEIYGGSDSSFVDMYKIVVTEPTRLFIDMRSTVIDPVIVLTNNSLREIEIFDDAPDSCNAHMDKVLPAGDYYILANTYASPRKCLGNVGAYTLSISDIGQPLMGDTVATTGATPISSLFTGGASADGGITFQNAFAATDTIAVKARIAVDPLHVGRSGRVIVLIQLSNGQKYSRNGFGQYVPFDGNLSNIANYKVGALGAVEDITIAEGLRAAGTNLAGLSYAVYVGYALETRWDDIYYGNSPIRFSIAP